MCLQFLRLIESFSLLACILPSLGSRNSVHNEIEQDHWRHEQDEERCSSPGLFPTI